MPAHASVTSALACTSSIGYRPFMRMHSRAPMLLVATALSTPACWTTGWIRFEAVDASAVLARQVPASTRVEMIDCADYQSAEQPFFHSRRPILYVTTCTKDGAGIPWRVLGAFHAASVAFDKWPKYSREVTEKARMRGCPALLLRKAPPTTGQEAHAIGALCVDPSRPSGVDGPMRLAQTSEGPLRVLSDGEPPTGLR